MKPESIASCITNQALSLTIMPTEHCNFRCTYCYEDFAIGKMNDDIVMGIKNLISVRLPELKYLSMEWFGGEPLSAKNIIYDISDHIMREISGKEIIYTSGMTTNGYQLTSNTFKKLLSKGITGYQISLDGPRDVHNKTRLRIDGSGSFDVIWKNLISMKSIDEDFKIMLRIHVTPENYLDLKSLVLHINEEFKDDKRFGVFFKAIENLGGNNAGSFKVLTGLNKKEILNELNSLIDEDKNFSPLDKSEPYICYASKPNNLVIRANGTLAKCTVALSDDRNNLGKINPDGRISLNSKKLALWTRGIKSLYESELHCPADGLPRLSSTSLNNIPITVIN